MYDPNACPYKMQTPQHTAATHCHTLQHTATHCTTLHPTAPHCNTLQHTATHCKRHRSPSMAAQKQSSKEPESKGGSKMLHLAPSVLPPATGSATVTVTAARMSGSSSKSAGDAESLRERDDGRFCCSVLQGVAVCCSVLQCVVATCQRKRQGRCL